MAETSRTTITEADIRDPKRLIWLLNRMHDQISLASGGSGIMNLPDINARSLKLSRPGSSDEDVLTISEGERRYGPEAVRRALNTRRDWASRPVQPVVGGGSGSLLRVGTHDERLGSSPGLYPQGMVWYESDRTVYYVNRGDVWYYLGGVTRGTLSPDEKPADLGADDEGYLFYSTDFCREYRWSGSAWSIDHSDRPNRVEFHCGNPGTGWALCDGSTVTRSNDVGGTQSVTTPDLIGAYIKGGSAYTGSVVAAVAPGITGTVDPAGAHSHTYSGTTGGPSDTFSTAAGVGPVGSPTHTHAYSGVTDAVADHTHTLTGLAVDDTGEPAHVELLPYLRL